MLIQRLARFDPPTVAWAIVTGGSVGRLALGFVASVSIARGLGVADFAIYALLGAMGGIAGVLGDPGLTQAGVKRVAEAWSTESPLARDRATSFFWLRCAAILPVVAGGALLAVPLARWVLGYPDIVVLVAVAFVGVGATAASGALTAVLQATGRFGRLSLVILVNSGLTAILSLALAGSGQLTLLSAILVLGAGTSVVSLVLGWHFLPWLDGLLPRPPLPKLRAEAAALFRFGRWLWVADLLATVTAQLDVLLINVWSGLPVVGAYALALNLASKADVVNHSLYTVLLPTASSLRGPAEVRRYVRRSVLRSGVIGLAFVPLFPLAGPLITLFYGPAYHAAIVLFQLLLAVVLFDVVATPLTLLAFSAERPGLVASADALRLAVLVLVGFWLIPTHGALGAVIARAASRIAGALLILVLLARSRPGSS